MEKLLVAKKRNRFQIQVLSVLKSLLTNKDTKSIRETFLSLDREYKGYLSIEDLREGFLKAEIEVDESALQKAFGRLDFDENGKISWSEFQFACFDSLILNSTSLRKVF